MTLHEFMVDIKLIIIDYYGLSRKRKVLMDGDYLNHRKRTTGFRLTALNEEEYEKFKNNILEELKKKYDVLIHETGIFILFEHLKVELELVYTFGTQEEFIEFEKEFQQTLKRDGAI